MDSNGIGSLSASQMCQIETLASSADAENCVLVAEFNGKKVTFSAINPAIKSHNNQAKSDKDAERAVKILGLKDRKVSPALAQKLIQAWNSVNAETDGDLSEVQFLHKHLAIFDNTQNSKWGSTTSLDSGIGSSISGSTESLNSSSDDEPDIPPPLPPKNKAAKSATPPPLPPKDHLAPPSSRLANHTNQKVHTTSSLSKEVAQLVKSKNYTSAHQKLAHEMLRSIEGNHITKARWKRFGYADKKIGNVPLPKETALKIGNDYIPANKIMLSNDNYVAIQAPKVQFGGDIWQAAMDSNSSIICDLTGENDKQGIRKGGPIEEYYPTQENKIKKFDNGVTVKFMAQAKMSGFTKTRYQVTDANGHTKILRRYNYTQWPDHGVPHQVGDKKALLKYIKALQDHKNSKDYTGNPMVHCTAGVGRTGTLIVLNEMYQDIQSGKYKNQGELDIAVFEAIKQGRNDRGPAFVQSDSQIEFIMDVVHTWLDKQNRGEELIP